MSALFWFIAAAVLAGAELLGAEFVLLMLAGGALSGAATALAVPDNPWLPFVVFAVVSVLLVVVVRPPLLRHFGRQGQARLGVHRVVGASGVVVEEVSEHAGQAKVGGEVWTARTSQGWPPLPVGTHVTVTEVRGATIYVSGGSSDE